MIRLRDDDVLVPSRSWEDPFGRFRQIHEWVKLCPGMVHVPTLIVEELKLFPEAIEYIRRETHEERMLPEFHAMWHVDPNKYDLQHNCDHLEAGIEWMQDEIGRTPTIWYTPWGANNGMLQEAAKKYGLELVDTSCMVPVERVCRQLQTGELRPESLRDAEIMCHWWEGGARILRIVHVLNHGSWEAAAKAERELFRCR